MAAAVAEALEPATQVDVDVAETETSCNWVADSAVNVKVFPEAAIPFGCASQLKLAPAVAFAVKVTVDPAQTVRGLADMDTVKVGG